MDGHISNGDRSPPPPLLENEVKPPREAHVKQKNDRPERQKLYDSITASTKGTRRYSTGDSRRPSATLRNISHSSRMGFPSSTPRDEDDLDTVTEETARDPRDTASPLTPESTSRGNSPYAGAPTVDFDGLSWPSMQEFSARELD